MWTLKNKYFAEESDDGSNGDGAPPADPAPPSTPPPADPAAPPATSLAADPAVPPTTPPAAPPVTPPAAKTDWPDDWRVKLSPDGKHAKTLDRFASPNAILDSYLALRQKVDSGELKSTSPYPDKGKEEEQVAWRKAHGIPETSEGYDLKFDDGLVIGEADKPIVDDFLKAAHDTNATPAQVNKLVKWYYNNQEKALQQQAEKDAAFLTQSEDTLHAEWGGEYRTNVNIIKGLVDTMPADVRDLFVMSRLGDGTALMNHPDIARWLVHTGRTVNPTATVIPGAGANIAGAIDDEIAAIEKVLNTDRKAYNKDEKMQARYRELLGAREKHRQ